MFLFQEREGVKIIGGSTRFGVFPQYSRKISRLRRAENLQQTPPPKDCRFRVPIRTPVRVLDGRDAPGKFSLLYIRFPVLGFKIPVRSSTTLRNFLHIKEFFFSKDLLLKKMFLFEKYLKKKNIFRKNKFIFPKNIFFF